MGLSKERTKGKGKERRKSKAERPSTCLQCESDSPIDSAISGEIPINDLKGIGFHAIKLSKV